jgi:hypothetical protein
MQKSLALLAVLAIPAAAHSMRAPAPTPPAALCFASGNTIFRLSADAAASDVRIRIEQDAPRADLRVQWADRAELADFVLVDDTALLPGGACRAGAQVRTVVIDNAAAAPDVVVDVASGGTADFKVYVHSARFSQQDAAALLAAMWKAAQQRERTASAVR